MRDDDFNVEFPGPALDARPVFDETSAVAPARPDPVLQGVLHTGSSACEELRIVVARLRALDAERRMRCIGVVSASPAEGKTTIAIGLAAALARETGRRVLLMEGDLRRPAIERYFGLSAEAGVADWLEAATGRRVGVRRLVPQRFFLLPAGRHLARRPEMLDSDRMSRLVEAARQCFDYVIVDCPPLGPVADALTLQDMVDGFLCVVRARHAPMAMVQKSLGRLSPERICGLVFNDHREVLPTSYRYAEKRYLTRG